MREEPVSDTLLRQFLLGNVDDQERQRLERMFVTGALSQERVIAAEQHLLDDFLENSLTPGDRERFLAQYGATPDEQRKLRIAKSIQEWAALSQEGNAVAAANASRWTSVRRWLKPVYVIPIAAVFLIAIICGAVWLNGRWEKRNRHLAIQQELVRLNAPSSSRDVSPVSLTLMPGAVRSAEPENELTPPVNAESVELRLVWRHKQGYASYQATIRRFHDEEVFTIPDLQLEPDSAIRLKVPAHYLTHGLYQIELSGIPAGGVASPPEEYRLAVKR